MPELDLEQQQGQPHHGEDVEPKVAAPESDEISVEIEDDPLYKKPDWKTDPAKNAEDPNDKDYGTGVQKRIGKLRASLTEAAKQRDKAARERDEAVTLARSYMSKVAELETTLNQGTVSYLDRQAETEEARIKLAEHALRQALSMGDPEAIAKANTDLASSAAQVAQLRTAINFRKSQLAQPQQAPLLQRPPQQQAAPRQAQQGDPLLDSWVGSNPWFQTDEEMTEAALELHDDIASKGVRVGSPRYYQLLDAGVKGKFPDYFGEEAPAAQKQVSRPSSQLAPSVRTSSSQQDNGTNTNRVKLTASQVSTAKRLGLTPEQYAREVVRLRREGVSV